MTMRKTLVAAGAALLIGGTLAACGDSKQVTEMEGRIKKLEAEIAALKSADQKAATQSAAAQKSFTDLKSAITAAQQTTEGLKRQSAATQIATESVKRLVGSAMQRMTNLEKSINDRLAQGDAKQAALTQSLSRIDTKMDGLRTEIEGTVKQAGADLSGLKDQLRAISQDVSAIKKLRVPAAPAAKPATEGGSTTTPTETKAE